jgi:hypothetical protein
MRRAGMGVLFVVSGVFFLAGVLNPPILPTWGDSRAELLATASAHKAAWFTTTWLLTVSIVAGLAGFELLVRALDTDFARVGRSLYLVGGALGLASMTYDLGVTSTLLDQHPVPDWYFGVQHWADALGTAYFALLAPAALGCAGIAMLRTRAFPLWTGWVFIASAVLLLGQYAAFRGALPFPQFLAFLAVGVGTLVRPMAPAFPAGTNGWPDRIGELSTRIEDESEEPAGEPRLP